MHEDLAWAIGLFEGEGCFTMNRDGRYRPQGRASLAMADKDLVERFHDIVGCGYLCPEVRDHRKETHKTMYRWQATSLADFWGIAQLFAPHLGKRRKERLMEIIQEVSVGRRNQFAEVREEILRGTFQVA